MGIVEVEEGGEDLVSFLGMVVVWCTGRGERMKSGRKMMKEKKKRRRGEGKWEI